MFDNKILNSLGANCNFDYTNDLVIHHFPGSPGNYYFKIHNMRLFLWEVKNYRKDLTNI
jgi:hypothetical protein